MVRDLDFRKMLPLLPEPEFPQPALRWRLGWLLFGGLLLLLFLRRFLNLFHFIFLSHGKHSSLFPKTKTKWGRYAPDYDPGMAHSLSPCDIAIVSGLYGSRHRQHYIPTSHRDVRFTPESGHSATGGH